MVGYVFDGYGSAFAAGARDMYNALQEGIKTREDFAGEDARLAVRDTFAKAPEMLAPRKAAGLEVPGADYGIRNYQQQAAPQQAAQQQAAAKKQAIMQQQQAAAQKAATATNQQGSGAQGAPAAQQQQAAQLQTQAGLPAGNSPPAPAAPAAATGAAPVAQIKQQAADIISGKAPLGATQQQQQAAQPQAGLPAGNAPVAQQVQARQQVQAPAAQTPTAPAAQVAQPQQAPEGAQNYDVPVGNIYEYTKKEATPPKGFLSYLLSGDASPAGSPAVMGYKFRNQSWTLPKNQADEYTKVYNRIKDGSFLKHPKIQAAMEEAKRLGVDPIKVAAIAAGETTGGTNIKDSIKDAKGLLQVTDKAYRQVRNMKPANKAIADVLQALPTDINKATPDQLTQVGILYMKYLEGEAKRNKADPLMAIAKYQGASSWDGYKNNWDLDDGNKKYRGTQRGDYVAKYIGYYNALNPSNQIEVPDYLIKWQEQRSKKGLVEAELAPGEGGEHTQTAGLSPTGEYQQAQAQAPEEEGIKEWGYSGAQLPTQVHDTLQQRNVISTYMNACLSTGDMRTYERLMKQQQELDKQVYEEVADIAAAELEYYNAPQRAMALINGMSNGNYSVALRPDGKIDLYSGDRLISGDNGLTKQQLAKYVRTYVSDKARQQTIASNTAAAAIQGELNKIAYRGQIDIIIEQLKQQGALTQQQVKVAEAMARSGGRFKSAGFNPSDNSLHVLDSLTGNIIRVDEGGKTTVNGTEVATPRTAKVIPVEERRG